MPKRKKISRRALKHAMENAQTASQCIAYLMVKIEKIRMETGLTLIHLRTGWRVQDENFRVKKRGTMEACADYIIDQWKKMK